MWLTGATFQTAIPSLLSDFFAERSPSTVDTTNPACLEKLHAALTEPASCNKDPVQPKTEDEG